MKLPFTWSLSSVWQTATNTIKTILNLAETPKKILWIFLKRQKPGSNQNNIARFSDKKLTNFQSSLQTVWNYLSHEYCQVDGKTTQTPSEPYWTWLKNRNKINVFLLKRQKLGSNQSTFVTFSDKTLTNFQSSLQRVWNYLSHEYCQVDGKTTQTPSERF